MADESGFEIARAYVTVDPDAGDFDAKLKEEIGDPKVVVGVEADAAEADATIDDLRAKLERLEETAAEITIGAEDGQANEVIDSLMAKLDALEAEHASLLLTVDDEGAQEKIAALSAEMDALQAQMTEVSTAAGVSGVAVGALGERSAELSTIAASAAERLNNFGGATEAIGTAAMASEGDVAALVERFNLANTELIDLERASTGEVPALDSLGGGFKSLGGDIDGFMAQGAGSTAELGRLGEEMTLLETELDELEGQFGTASGAFASFGAASEATAVELHNSAGMYEGVAEALDATEVATVATTDATTAATSAGHGAMGMWGMLTDVLTSTPVILGAVVVGMGAMAYEFSKSGTMAEDYTNALAKQYGATQDNVKGWDSFASAMQSGGAANEALSRQLSDVSVAQARFGGTSTESAQAIRQVGQAAQEAAQKAQQVTFAVTAMQSRLGVTGPMAERLAYDEQMIGDKAAGAKAQVGAFSNEIKLLTGNMNTNWQMQLGIQGGYDSLKSALNAAHASMTGMNSASVEAQQDFAAQVATLDAYGQHQQTAGKMTQATSDYITGQTAKLALLAGGNKQAIASVEGMISQEVLWGAKTSVVHEAVDNLSKDIQGNFIGALAGMGIHSATADKDMANLASSVLKTGDTSAQTAADRAKLISDLEAIGVKAGLAEKIADELTGAINRIPTSKTIQINVNTTETEKVIRSIGGNSGVGILKAQGGIISGGVPGRDSVPILAMPGEVVVPTSMVNAGMVDHLRGKLPGFAGGGQVTTAGYQFPQDVFNFDVNVGFGRNNGWGTGGGSGGEFGRNNGWGGDGYLPGELRPGSDITTMNDDGKALAKAFENAYKDTVSQIKEDTRDALSTIREYYSGPAATQLEATISRQGAALENLANKTASVATEIASMKSYAAQETQSLQSFSDVGNIQGTTNTTTGVTAAPTGQQISAGLKQDLATLRKFFSLIGELKAKKVDATMINQVIALGPDEGVTYAEAILAGGANLIKQINKEESQIASIEVKIGQRAADIEFGQPLALGFLHALDKEKAELEKRMKHLGDVVAKELQDALEKLKITIPVTTTGKKASTGWRVPGFGGGDRHPALLEGGETVVSKEHSQIPLMQHAFAAAGVPGYSDGGIVLSTGQPYIGPGALAAPAPSSARGAINVNYYGPQRPTPEMEAAMLLKLATAVGAAG